MFAVQVFVERRYGKTSLPLPRYYCIIFTVAAVLPRNFPRPPGYRGITAFHIIVSFSTTRVPTLFWHDTHPTMLDNR